MFYNHWINHFAADQPAPGDESELTDRVSGIEVILMHLVSVAARAVRIVFPPEQY